MVDPEVGKRFWNLPSVAIGVVFLFAQLPLFSPLTPSRWHYAFDSNLGGVRNIYYLKGRGLGILHFEQWWVVWLIALALALGFVYLKNRAGASVALAVSALPVLVGSLDWLDMTVGVFEEGIAHRFGFGVIWFPNLAWLIVIVGYAYAFIGIARMRSPAVATPVVPPSGKRNVYAVWALVIGILGGWLAIVFGHLALSQIRKTGQKGRDMATMGLVLGYIWVPITIAFLILAPAYSRY